MINLRALIDLLPPYYKDNDTYKDEHGQGILERFIGICGDYFQDDVVKDIDNTMNLIDVDVTDDIYLNYIWEMFGSIPYAYGVLIDTRLWETYSNIADNKDIWIKVIDALPPRARPRDILKYAIPLYKIRGTLGFYNILLGFYGYSCTLTDPTGDFERPQSTIYEFVPYYDIGLVYDDNDKYDISANCLSCVEVTIVVNTEHPSELINEDFMSRLCLILNRFRPLNVIEFSNKNVTIINTPPQSN